MSPTVQLRYCLLAFLMGIILGLKLMLWFSILGVLVSFLGLYFKPSFSWVILVFLFIGASYNTLYSIWFYPQDIKYFVGESIILKAEIKGEARFSRTGSQTALLQLKQWRSRERDWMSIDGNLLWQNAPLPVYNAGETVVLSGTITNVSNFSNDFDAQAYWSRWGIAQSIIRVQVISREPSELALNTKWRETAIDRLSPHLQKPHSTVALGMLIGLKEKLPKALEEDFKTSGLQHLLVVSGTNVTLLIIAVGLCLKPLGPWYKYTLGMIALASYLYLVGFDPPALRATLFGVIAGFAVTSGFNLEYRNLFLLGAMILILFDPRFLTHDVSFWLSFAATGGIFVGIPIAYYFLSFMPWKSLRLLIAASFCAQIAVFPILIINFGSFPYTGLVSNLITEPLVPLIMFLAAGAVFIGDREFMFLESIWGGALEFSITALISLAQFMAQLPILYIPAWGGYVMVLLLGGISLWACVSNYYQVQYWEAFEAEMKLS